MSSESETGKIPKIPKADKTESTASGKHDKSHDGGATDLHVRQLVRFVVGDIEFGVDVGLVREIKRASDMVGKRAAASDIRGTVSVDDHVVDVIDLGSRLGYQPRPPIPASRIIIFCVRDQTRGALVDEVIDILRLEETAKDKPVSPDFPIEGALVRETLMVDKRRIMVLDWPRILGL